MESNDEEVAEPSELLVPDSITHKIDLVSETHFLGWYLVSLWAQHIFDSGVDFLGLKIKFV